MAARSPITCEVPVFFATSEGQTRRIAKRIASVLHDLGLESCAIDIAGPEAAEIDWTHVRGALVGASLHRGKHQKAAERFVRSHALDLTDVPSAFFSVSLSAASKNAREVEAAKDLAKAFPAGCGWTPVRIDSVAGRLAYREYGFFIRLVMKRIARKEGAPTDTSRDYELTNWEEVDKLARDMARRVHARAAVRGVNTTKGGPDRGLAQAREEPAPTFCRERPISDGSSGP
jgi:menaquinone-dependent protoporphyrinogen oxidase